MPVPVLCLSPRGCPGRPNEYLGILASRKAQAVSTATYYSATITEPTLTMLGKRIIHAREGKQNILLLLLHVSSKHKNTWDGHGEWSLVHMVSFPPKLQEDYHTAHLFHHQGYFLMSAIVVFHVFFSLYDAGRIFSCLLISLLRLINYSTSFVGAGNAVCTTVSINEHGSKGDVDSGFRVDFARWH